MLRLRSTFCPIKVNTQVLEVGFATADLANVVKLAKLSTFVKADCYSVHMQFCSKNHVVLEFVVCKTV